MEEAGLYPTGNHCTAVLRCMLLYQIPYMHISNAYHSWGYALKGRQREFNWDVEDGAFLLLACCREAGEDHTNAKVDSKCSLEMLHVLLLTGRPEGTCGRERWR